MRNWLVAHKRNWLIAISISCLFFALWHVFAGKIRQDVQSIVIGQLSQKLNGQLSAGDVSVSLTGYIKIENVSLYDQGGSLLAKIPAVKIKYHWTDLTGRSLGMPKIEQIILEDGEFWLQENNNHFNWDGLLPKEQNEPSSFRGSIQLTEAKIHIQTPLLSQRLEHTTGMMDWQNHPEMTISLNGKADESTVALTGQWGEEQPGAFTILVDKLPAGKCKNLLAGTGYSLEEGTIQSLVVHGTQDKKGTLHYQAEGYFTGLSLTGKVELRDGRGSFSSDETGLWFKNVTLLLEGQTAQGQGKILWNGGKGILDFSFSLADADPAAFMPGLTAASPLALQVKIKGPVTQPAVWGSFSLPQISFSNMLINDVQGNFHYAGKDVVLRQIKAATCQGTLNASGTIATNEQRYELDVEGQGLNSTYLTAKDVQGPLSFSGHISGKGETAVTKGSFSIQNGKTYGISFEKMTGSFVKAGTATDLSGIAIETLYGIIYPDQLGQEALARLRQQDLPVSMEELKQVVAGKLIDKLL